METPWSVEHGSARSGTPLAVLHFNNLSGSKKDEYFRDGVTEDILIELSRISGFSVASLSAVRLFRDRSVPAIQIGRELNVAYVLDGNFRRVKNHLRLSVELVETRTGLTVWAERYDREVKDVFTIQKEIAEAIARKLSVMISEEEKRAIRKVPTTRVEAYDCYLRGRQHFRQFRRKSIEVARAEFERAIEIDPEEPQVLYNVACVHTLQGLFDKALDCLAKTVAHGELWREWMRNDPDLESLHDHSRYRALAAGTESPS